MVPEVKRMRAANLADQMKSAGVYEAMLGTRWKGLAKPEGGSGIVRLVHQSVYIYIIYQLYIYIIIYIYNWYIIYIYILYKYTLYAVPWISLWFSCVAGMEWDLLYGCKGFVGPPKWGPTAPMESSSSVWRVKRGTVQALNFVGPQKQRFLSCEDV